MDQAHYDELLSAYLDRELSPDERATVDRLLEKSVEARERLHDLEVTSRFMRAQPQLQLGVDFADGVIDRLRSESLIRPAPAEPKPILRRNVWWVGAPLAAAATLLVAVGVWNYQSGHGDLSRAPDRFNGVASESFTPEPGSAVASIDRGQWEKGDIVEIRGPTGEKQFELFVVKAIEPNTLKCILAESRDSDPIGSDATTPYNEPAGPTAVTTLVMEADQEQLDQLHGLLALSNDGAGAAFHLVDIVTDTEPERIRVTGVGLQTRLPGLGGNQASFAAREPDKMDDETGAGELRKDRASPAFAAKQLSETPNARRMQSGAQPPASPPTKEERMASLQRNILPMNSGLPLAMPEATDGESASVRSEAALAEKKVHAAGTVALKSAAALQDRGQQVPVRIKQMDVKQQVSEALNAATATDSKRNTPGRVKELAESKPAERPAPGLRTSRQVDKEPQRRVEVLLRFRNDRPE